MRVKLRHKITAAIVRPLFYAFAKLRYRFEAEKFDYSQAKGPYLILSNHCTDIDALLLAICFKEPIYFVANDHLFRLGFVSKIITYLCSPIPILKSTLDLRTIRDIRTLAADGGSIGLFPEGNRTFNGQTSYISESIGKLAKLLKMPIVLYSLEGGYLTSPRWASHDRRGRLNYKFKGVVTYDAYKDMSPEGITGIIREALEMEAPQSNKVPYDGPNQIPPEPIGYYGKNPAESLERTLYKCPVCKAYCSITTENDKGSCYGCGLAFTYTKSGYLIGDRLPFNRVLDWDLWQREELIRDGVPFVRSGLLPISQEACSGLPVFQDTGEVLYEIIRAQRNIKIGEGTLSFYNDCITFKLESKKTASGQESGLKIFPLSDMMEMVVYSKQNLQFTLENGCTYVLKNPKPRSALKYVYHYYYLRQMKKGEINGFLGI